MVNASQKASEIRSWLESACWDCCGGDEAEADKIFNDADMLQDMVGDKIYDLVGGKKEDALAVIAKMKENAHWALRKALQKTREHFEKFGK